MFTVGSVGRHYRSIYRPTLGRYIGRVAVDTRSTYRPSVGRVSVEYRPNVGRVSADTSADMCVGRYGFSLVDTRPIPYRYFTDSLPIPYRYSVDTLPILGASVGSYSADQVDMSRSICPSLIARRYLTISYF